uniref:Anaphase-promoting complex subunit 2 TPR repeats domain-containing protein n=1 Tax=Amphimedon queenslandica TaxID=400682 RepID=A0A1X7TLD5_AMPQE
MVTKETSGFIERLAQCHICKEWSGRILHHIYNCYGRLRISLVDLCECLHHIDLKEELMDSLTKVYESRLLHHGANTSDIITQYISSVRSLKLLDPTGVVLERACEPVKAYLRTQSDTVTCIMASLIDDSSNDLSEELAKGETVLLDLSDEYDDPDQDFEAWEPDPVDANPMKSSKSRQTSDIMRYLKPTIFSVY